MARKPCKPKIGHAIYHAYASQIVEPRPSWFVRVEDQHLRGHHGLLRRNVRRNRGFELPAGSFTAQVLSYLGGSNAKLSPCLHGNEHVFGPLKPPRPHPIQSFLT